MLLEVTILSNLSLFYNSILFSQDAPTTTEIEVIDPTMALGIVDSAITSEEEAVRQEMRNLNHRDVGSVSMHLLERCVARDRNELNVESLVERYCFYDRWLTIKKKEWARGSQKYGHKMEFFSNPNEPFTYGLKVSKKKSILSKDCNRITHSVDKAN